MTESNQQSAKPAFGRTFTFRAALIGVVGMVFMAIWVHFHEVLTPHPNILAENSPPASAVGVLVGILLIGALVALIKPKLRLAPGEMVVIYTMLVVSAPIMTQGMWHRFLGLVTAIPREKNNLALVDSYSEKLWPHGRHLVPNRRFELDRPERPWTVEPAANARYTDVEDSPVGATTAIEIFNPLPADEEVDTDELLTRLTVRIPRWNGEVEQLVPGERYYFNALVRTADMLPRSRLTVELIADSGELVPIVTIARDTEATYSDRGRFKRTGDPYVSLPREFTKYADLCFTLEGPGRAAMTDLTFFSNEALARMYKGTTEVRASDLARVPQNERDALLVRPDSLARPAGIWYAIKGYVPYDQWLVPLVYWLSIVLAVFFCLLGISVIFRRQWADNERFSFPLVVIPRLLIEEDERDGRRFRPLFRKRLFHAGVAFAFLYCLLQGLAYYVPNMPDPTINVQLQEYVSSPAAKAFIKGMAPTTLMIHLTFVSVAFFIDLEMLASILIFFWVCKIPYYFGELLGWKNIKGPLDAFPFPHEQHLGAFLGLALLVIWISRKHLGGAFRRVFSLSGAVDDSGEAMSYRAAALLIVASFVFFAVWGIASGLGAGSALIFFGFIVVCGLSAARIRTECGAPMTYFTPYYPYLVFFMLGGLSVFGTPTMVLAFCVGGFMAVAQFLMFAPSQVEMFHLGNHFKANPKGINKALICGIVGGVLLGGYVMLVWAYGQGGENIPYMRNWGLGQNWYLSSLRQAVIDANAAALSTAAQGEVVEATKSTGPAVATGVGFGVTLLLVILRTRFVGFWLHPIGYVLANSHFVHMCWGSLLTAWAAKFLALKIGGPRLIREHMTPLMAGVLCGALLGMAFWDLTGLIALACGARDVFTAFP